MHVKPSGSLRIQDKVLFLRGEGRQADVYRQVFVRFLATSSVLAQSCGTVWV